MTASIIRYFDYAAISQLLVKNLSSFKEQRQIVKFSRILRKKNYFSVFINFTDQRHVVDPVKNLWWSFFSKTVDYFQPSTIFAKKRNHSHMPEFKIRLYDWPKVPENLWRFFIHCITYWVQKNFYGLLSVIYYIPFWIMRKERRRRLYCFSWSLINTKSIWKKNS